MKGLTLFLISISGNSKADLYSPFVSNIIIFAFFILLFSENSCNNNDCKIVETVHDFPDPVFPKIAEFTMSESEIEFYNKNNF